MVMKLIILAIFLSLIVCSFLLSSCNEQTESDEDGGSLAGESVRYRIDSETKSNEQFRLKCKNFDYVYKEPKTGQILCNEKNYDSCTSAVFLATYVDSSGVEKEVIFPADCVNKIDGRLWEITKAYRYLIEPVSHWKSTWNSESLPKLQVRCCKIIKG
jgi:hypothetical protein